MVHWFAAYNWNENIYTNEAVVNHKICLNVMRLLKEQFWRRNS